MPSRTYIYIILKNIRSNTYMVSPLNKVSGNELILEGNTGHIDSENLCYQHLINQPEQTISNDQCSNETDNTK